MHAYLVGLVADGIEILPIAGSKIGKQGAEARYASTLGIKGRDANRKIEPSEAAPGFPLSLGEASQ